MQRLIQKTWHLIHKLGKRDHKLDLVCSPKNHALDNEESFHGDNQIWNQRQRSKKVIRKFLFFYAYYHLQHNMYIIAHNSCQFSTISQILHN